jgi:hypothetical protein
MFWGKKSASKKSREPVEIEVEDIELTMSWTNGASSGTETRLWDPLLYRAGDTVHFVMSAQDRVDRYLDELSTRTEWMRVNDRIVRPEWITDMTMRRVQRTQILG